MGRDKALVELRGIPLVTHVATALRSVCDSLLVVGREGTLEGIESVPDDRSGPLGPGAGVATALRIAEGRPVLAVAVDQPFVRAETLQRLSDGGGSIIPQDGVLQVTCAVYGPELTDAVVAAVDDGVPVWRVVRDRARIVTDVEWRSWGEDGRSWYSVDTLEALAEGTARFG
jgi:molybdopterin-guanine dinucleotide biosynthesis protein A